MPVVKARTGAVRDAASCSAVQGASHYPSAEAPWPQSLPDGLGSQGRALAALGGGLQVVGPDHLQAAVSQPQRYEPPRHRTSAALAPPSGVASVPARAARPRDQAKVAVGVQGVARWLLARLRPHPCFALLERHTALTELRLIRHPRPCKTRPGARQRGCAALDRPALRPRPTEP